MFQRLGEGKPTRMRRLGLETSETAAYTLTLLLLGFKCTWYELKSKAINAFRRPSCTIAHGGGLSLLPAPTLALDLHAHTLWHCLLLLGQSRGGVHVLKYILFIPFE